MKIIARLSVLTLMVALLTACGGGGGSGGGDGDSTPNPPTNNIPNPPLDPDPNPNPDPDPTPDPTPSADSPQAYQSSIEKMVGALLLVEKAGKAGVHKIPALVAEQVTAHGPSVNCDVVACDPDYHEPEYTVYLPTGEEVSIANWIDVNKNLVFDPDFEVLAFSVTNVYGITGSSMVMYRLEGGRDVYYTMLGNRYDDLNGRGAQIGTTQSLLYSGVLMIRELEDGRLRIGDDDREPSETRNITLMDVTKDGVIPLQTVFSMETNATNSDAILANFDWVPYGGGRAQAFQTISPLDFGEVDGRVVLEGGSFLYTQEDPDGTRIAVRVSVGADPSTLYFEIDQGAEGYYESSGFVSQPDLNFTLP